MIRPNPWFSSSSKPLVDDPVAVAGSRGRTLTACNALEKRWKGVHKLKIKPHCLKLYPTETIPEGNAIWFTISVHISTNVPCGGCRPQKIGAKYSVCHITHYYRKIFQPCWRLFRTVASCNQTRLAGKSPSKWFYQKTKDTVHCHVGPKDVPMFLKPPISWAKVIAWPISEALICFLVASW